MVKFADFTPDEEKAVKTIIQRTAAMVKDHGKRLDRTSLYMDLSAAHATCPLNLAKLASADDFNLAHDVFGIMRHMNRTTGQLMDCFVPRAAI